MAAIITDQIRILNAKNFVSGITSSSNSYYSFIGLPNPADYQDDWDSNPPAPKDNFSQENDYWDTMVALKKINAGDGEYSWGKMVMASRAASNSYSAYTSGGIIGINTSMRVERSQQLKSKNYIVSNT